MKLNTSISDGNRILFQSLPIINFPDTNILFCCTSQCPVHFSKEVLDWFKWNVHVLQALVKLSPGK
jgi:hypothetical protein